MADAIVREWLYDYKELSSSEIHSFANTTQQNNELIQAVFIVLEEKKHHPEFLELVCQQLFSFYRSREEQLQRFALQYLPVLIGIYLSAVARGDKKHVRCIEVLLLGVYNLEVIDLTGKPVSQTFRIPSISKPSIYHEPISLSHSVLTEHALSKLEHGDSRSNIIGPFPEVEKIIASNRLQVMTVLMRVYNRHIGTMSKFSHISVCKMCSRVVRQGYSRTPGMVQWCSYSNDNSLSNPHPRTIPRIPLSSSLLLEMIHSAYFSMFNGHPSLGLQALDDIQFRGAQEMSSEVLLVSNAIVNSLKVNPSGQPCDGPMGISVALSPTTTTTTVSKAIITNASFRTKKLPEDIENIGTKETLSAKLPNGTERNFEDRFATECCPNDRIELDNVQNTHPITNLKGELNSFVKDDIPIQEDGDNVQLTAISEETEDLDRGSRPNSVTSKNREKRRGSGSSSSTTIKLPVLQLRKDKAKDKKKEKEAIIPEVNGSSKLKKDVEASTSQFPLKTCNNEEQNYFPSGDAKLCSDSKEHGNNVCSSDNFDNNCSENSLHPKTSIPDNCETVPLDEISLTSERKSNSFINNHAGDIEETVIASDGTFIVQPAAFKREGDGSNPGKQNSSLQTIV